MASSGASLRLMNLLMFVWAAVSVSKPVKEVLEDDDFEEFPAEDWQTKEESFPVWEDNWDDDDVEEDFHQQLMSQKR